MVSEIRAAEFTAPRNDGVHKSWVATLGDSSDDMVSRLAVFARDDCTVFVAGRELCPTTGRRHLQCAFTVRKSARFSALCSMFRSFSVIGSQVYVAAQIARKSGLAEMYCRKDGDVVIDHNNKGAGKQTESLVAAEEVIAGVSMACVARKFPATFIRFHRGLERLRDVLCDPEDRGVVNCWAFIGRTGCGKSFAASRWRPFKPVLAIGGTRANPTCTVWFDGYKGEETVLFDDFAGQVDFRSLLNYMDGYAMRVPVKGGSVCAAWKRVIFTSNLDIVDWYPGQCLAELAPICRRFEAASGGAIFRDSGFPVPVVERAVEPVAPSDAVATPPRPRSPAESLASVSLE